MQNIILKAGKDSSVFPISIEAEFSEQKGTLTMNFAWGGNEFKTGHGRGRPLFRHHDQAFQGHYIFKRCEEPSADTPVNGSGRYSEEIKLLDKKGASPR